FNITNSTELGLIDGRIYHSTFLNVYMSAVKFNEFTLTRFQSVFYEPGTFAFLLLPVIYWYKIVDYKPFKFATLILMLLFTFSVGAMLTAITASIIYYFIKKPVTSFPYFFILLVAFIFSLSFFPVFLDFLSNKFGLGIYEGTSTSGGTRVQELRYVGEAFESVIGSGFSGLINVDTFGGNISVGLFQMIIYSGLIGGIALIIFHIILGGYSLQKFASKDNRSIFVGATLFSFISMGLQRATFMDGVLLIILFAFLLKFDVERKEHDPK
ncbi:hypothetical protein, partial [Psychromonas antarctica]|uniref:hypothetical protein n=1 Tax=Psychromonas antarctica TaxID=67573 RepID=UPI001EE96E10